MTNQAPEIFFIDDGNGDAIVFLHGFLESHEIWDDFTDKLNSKYRIISLDLPGHGRSSMLSEAHDMEMMAEELKVIMEILGIHKCLLVGHSMGGYAAIEFASKYARLLKGLVLLNSHVASDTEEESVNRDRSIELIDQDHLEFLGSFTKTLFAPSNVKIFEDEIESLKKIAVSTSKEGAIAALRGMKRRKDHVDTLKKLRVPVLIIAGDQDARIPLDKIKEQVKAAPRVRLEVLEDVGHMSFVEAREYSYKLIKDFAESVFFKPKQQ
jgi:pimeloyl-ACP methyl ester carboxylesterase